MEAASSWGLAEELVLKAVVVLQESGGQRRAGHRRNATALVHKEASTYVPGAGVTEASPDGQAVERCICMGCDAQWQMGMVRPLPV